MNESGTPSARHERKFGSLKIHRVIAEGDTAVVHCTHSGRHTGDYFGIKPSGHRFAYKQMHMIRVVDVRRSPRVVR